MDCTCELSRFMWDKQRFEKREGCDGGEEVNGYCEVAKIRSKIEVHFKSVEGS